MSQSTEVKLIKSVSQSMDVDRSNLCHNRWKSIDHVGHYSPLSHINKDPSWSHWTATLTLYSYIGVRFDILH